MTPFQQLGYQQKEAARGDQFLKATQRALTSGATGVNPETRMRTLNKLVDTGYHGGVENTLASILQGGADQPGRTGMILKLLTGHGTANSKNSVLANFVRQSSVIGRGSESRNDASDLLKKLPKLVESFAPRRQTTRLPNLPTDGIMSALRLPRNGGAIS